MCDPREGCTVSVPIPQATIVQLCQQTQGMDPANGCIFCDPNGDQCNQAPPTGLCRDNANRFTCLTCVAPMAGMDPTCTGAMQMCPPPP
jgi:hypothetical protein